MKSHSTVGNVQATAADDPDEIGELDYQIRRRLEGTISVRLPQEVLASLERVAEERSTSVEAVVRMYIGTGLRQDIARLYGERVLASVERVLTQHIDSQEEVEAIVRELHEAAGGSTVPWAADAK